MEDDKLLVGLDTMRSWGVIDKNFPKPNSTAFNRSKENMDAIQLYIAVIEKAIQDSDDSEEKTIKAEECNSTKHENVSSDENKNIIDTEKCTKHEESENKEFTTESSTKPDKSENNDITTNSTESDTTDTAPL